MGDRVKGRGKSKRTADLSHIGDDYGPLASLAAPRRRVAGLLHIGGDFAALSAHQKRAGFEFAEALSRVHSHLVVLAEGQDAILRALKKRGRYGQG